MSAARGAAAVVDRCSSIASGALAAILRPAETYRNVKSAAKPYAFAVVDLPDLIDE